MLRRVIIPTSNLYQERATVLEQITHAGIPLMVVESQVVETVNLCPFELKQEAFSEDFLTTITEHGFDLKVIFERGLADPLVDFAYALYTAVYACKGAFLEEAAQGHFVSGVSYEKRLGYDLVILMEISHIRLPGEAMGSLP